jgi:hypothetical protein
MPKAFEDCVSGGGKVRTKKLGGGKYMHICFKDGKSYSGEVKQNTSEGKVTKGAFMRAAGKLDK